MKKHTPSLLVLGALVCGSVYAADADLTDLQTFAPESKEYKLVYKADLLKGTDAKGNPVYVTDNSADFAGKKAERLGYYLRLTDLQGGVRRVFVTMKSFTGDVREAGIPRMNPKTPFQVEITDLRVKSDVPGVENGTFAKGNIEFWPTNYMPNNKKNIPGADDKTFDFGDWMATNGDYGSMQIHNTAKKQTVMAVNNWKTKQNTDLGIGNKPSGNPDWTFTHNGKKHKSATLLILAK